MTHKNTESPSTPRHSKLREALEAKKAEALQNQLDNREVHGDFYVQPTNRYSGDGCRGNKAVGWELSNVETGKTYYYKDRAACLRSNRLDTK